MSTRRTVTLPARDILKQALYVIRVSPPLWLAVFASALSLGRVMWLAPSPIMLTAVPVLGFALTTIGSLAIPLIVHRAVTTGAGDREPMSSAIIRSVPSLIALYIITAAALLPIAAGGFLLARAVPGMTAPLALIAHIIVAPLLLGAVFGFAVAAVTVHRQGALNALRAALGLTRAHLRLVIRFAILFGSLSALLRAAVAAAQDGPAAVMPTLTSFLVSAAPSATFTELALERLIISAVGLPVAALQAATWVVVYLVWADSATKQRKRRRAAVPVG